MEKPMTMEKFLEEFKQFAAERGFAVLAPEPPQQIVVSLTVVKRKEQSVDDRLEIA
jgi:hypothetical protein